MTLRRESYVAAGQPAMAIVNADSYHVRGYFEETKIPQIRAGDKVTIRPMGLSKTLDGHVVSIARAIADREAPFCWYRKLQTYWLPPL